MPITTKGGLSAQYGTDPEMARTLRGELTRQDRVRPVDTGDDMVPDWIKQGEKAYFASKSYTPEQRAAITTRARRGIPLRARTK